MGYRILYRQNFTGVSGGLTHSNHFALDWVSGCCQESSWPISTIKANDGGELGDTIVVKVIDCNAEWNACIDCIVLHWMDRQLHRPPYFRVEIYLFCSDPFFCTLPDDFRKAMIDAQKERITLPR